jgi:hypothetical protein
MMWMRGMVPVKTPQSVEARDGMVSDNGHWGIHIDGYHVNLTHRASGRRVGRFKTIGHAIATAEGLAALPDVDWSATNPYNAMTQEQERDALRIIIIFQNHPL